MYLYMSNHMQKISILLKYSRLVIWNDFGHVWSHPAGFLLLKRAPSTWEDLKGVTPLAKNLVIPLLEKLPPGTHRSWSFSPTNKKSSQQRSAYPYILKLLGKPCLFEMIEKNCNHKKLISRLNSPLRWSWLKASHLFGHLQTYLTKPS